MFCIGRLTFFFGQLDCDMRLCCPKGIQLKKLMSTLARALNFQIIKRTKNEKTATFLKSLETLSVNFVDMYTDGVPWHRNCSCCSLIIMNGKQLPQIAREDCFPILR